MASPQTNRRPLVAVIGSSEADANMIRLAEEVGAVVAKLGAGLGRSRANDGLSLRNAPEPSGAAAGPFHPPRGVLGLPL